MEQYLTDIVKEKHYDEISRKNRLESKVIGYFTVFSIIVSLASIFVVFWIDNCSPIFSDNIVLYFFDAFILLLSSQLYFQSLILAIFLFRCLKIDDVQKFPIEDHNIDKLISMNDIKAFKTIRKSMYSYYKNNESINKKLQSKIELCYYILRLIFILIFIFIIAVIIRFLLK